MAWDGGNRKVVVTGADGFIGSHVTEALVRGGATVRALSWYDPRGHRGWLDSLPRDVLQDLEIVSGDVRDAGAMRSLVQSCDAVLHLAALIGIPYSYQAPASYVDTNITGTLNLLEASRDAGVQRFVHTSTSEVYGTAQQVPMTEDHPLNAQSPYAATKIAADQLALSYHRSFGLPVAVLRPFNTYGPRQSARAIIPTIISQVAAGQDEIRLGSTDPTRDLVFVTDTADAFLRAATAERAVGRVTHTGTGHEVSVGDLAQIIGELMGRRIRVRTDPHRQRPRESEVQRLCCDPSQAAAILQWTPQFAGRSGLRQGLAATIDWFAQAAEAGRMTSQAAVYAV